MSVQISSEVYDALFAVAQKAPRREVCGLLFGTANRIELFQEIDNISSSIEDSFEIDPKELIAAHKRARAGGLPILGHFHSHPNGVPYPSDRDKAAAAGDGSYWLIMTVDKLTLWQSQLPGELTFVALTVEDIR